MRCRDRWQLSWAGASRQRRAHLVRPTRLYRRHWPSPAGHRSTFLSCPSHTPLIAIRRHCLPLRPSEASFARDLYGLCLCLAPGQDRPTSLKFTSHLASGSGTPDSPIRRGLPTFLPVLLDSIHVARPRRLDSIHVARPILPQRRFPFIIRYLAKNPDSPPDSNHLSSHRPCQMPAAAMTGRINPKVRKPTQSDPRSPTAWTRCGHRRVLRRCECRPRVGVRAAARGSAGRVFDRR